MTTIPIKLQQCPVCKRLFRPGRKTQRLCGSIYCRRTYQTEWQRGYDRRKREAMA